MPKATTKKIWLLFALVFLAAGGFVLFSSSSAFAQAAPEMTVEELFKAFSGESDPDKRSITLRVVVAVKAVMLPALQWMMMEFYAIMAPAINAFLLLVMVVFGVQVATGAVRSPRGDFVILGIKLALVYEFTANISGWVPMLMEASDEMLAIFSKMLTENFFGCSTDTLMPPGITVDNPDQYLVWKQLDCIFIKFLGFSSVGVGASIFAGLLASTAISEYFGPLITVAGVGGFIGFLYAILRVTYTYIISIIGLSFMLIISPMFVPLVLFQATRSYFDKWLSNTGAFFLQPAMQMALVAFMVQVFAVTIFTSERSVMAVIMCNAGSEHPTPAKGCEATCADMKNIDNFSMDCLLSAMEQKYIVSEQVASTAEYQAMKKELTSGVPDIPNMLFGALRGSDTIAGTTNQSFSASWQMFDPAALLPPEVLAESSSPQQRFEALMKSGQIIISFIVMLIITMAMFTMMEIMPSMIRQLINRSYRISESMFSLPTESNFQQGLRTFQEQAMSGASLLPGATNEDPNATMDRWTAAATAGGQTAVSSLPMGGSLWALVEGVIKPPEQTPEPTRNPNDPQ